MALVKFSRVAALITNKSNLGAITSVRNHWNKDFKPAPYPVTQKQREAAAKKYGVPIEEYEPYPDDGLGFGDYPKLPYKSVEHRDPYYPYDFPEHKRNFQEPFHANIDEISEDRVNLGEGMKKKLLNNCHDQTKLCFRSTSILLVNNVVNILGYHGFYVFTLLLVRRQENVQTSLAETLSKRRKILLHLRIKTNEMFMF